MEDHQPVVAEAVLCKWGGARSAWVGLGEPHILLIMNKQVMKKISNEIKRM